jgi:hypothetical protein
VCVFGIADAVSKGSLVWQLDVRAGGRGRICQINDLCAERDPCCELISLGKAFCLCLHTCLPPSFLHLSCA